MFRHLKRALADNLQGIQVQPKEATRLGRRGIDHETLQRYLVWRRSVFIFILALTLACALINTVNDTWFAGNSLAALAQRLGLDLRVNLPQAPRTRFANLADTIMDWSLYILPLTALAAALTWQRWRRSHRLLLAGWLIGFLVPVAFAIVPLTWLETEPSTPAMQFFEAIYIGIQFFVTVLPTVLSLVPGVVRACMRIKTLLPQSIIPGWVLVAMAPFYSLLILVVWVAFCHVFTNLVLLIGVLLWMSAPLVYSFNARAIIRPLITAGDEQRFQRVRLISNLVGLVAVVLLAAFLLTEQVLGMHLVGLDPATSLVRPWEVLQYYLEYLGRSLFVTVLATDLFMRLNRSIWQQIGDFAGTPQAEEYSRLMSQLKEVEG